MSADDFNKFLHQRGIRREGDMKRLEDHLKQSFKVCNQVILSFG